MKARNAREFIIPCPSGPGDQDHSDDELRDLEGQTSIYETPKQSVYHEKNESSEEESFDRPLHELEQEESTDSTDGLLNVEERMNIWIKKRLVCKIIRTVPTPKSWLVFETVSTK